MKRLLTLIIGLAIVAATAYAEHFKFMGITMDGDLATFEKGLLAKGFTPQEDCQDNTPTAKWYEGTFFGQDVVLCVNLTPKSKKVFSIDIGYKTKMDKDRRDMEVKELTSAIKSKYDVNKIIPGDNDGRVIYYVNNSTGAIGLNNVPPRIVIVYVDIENNNLFSSEIEEDIHKD